MAFIRTSKAKLIGAVLAGVLVVSAVVIALTTPNADAATPQIVPLCATAAVGQARCLAERQAQTVSSYAQLGTVSPDNTPGGYGPADLASAYQLDTSKGFGQTVAIIDAYDDPTAASDLAVYRSEFGLPACTAANGCFQKVNQNGQTSPLPAANSGWAGEISLDLDMVSAVCPQCSILLVEANSSYLSDLGAGVDTAVRMGAKFVSNSYGGGEYNGIGGNDVHYNHPGVAITASTGDSGYGNSYPASSPYVTAVGGTSLTRSATSRGWTEAAWGGAGSGCSGYESKPSFQTMTGCSNRAMADVSAVANPNTGVAVYNGGGWGVFGGTSASAPIIAATYALAGTPGANDYPNTYPYAFADSLNDVTSGSNGSCATASWCAAQPGWDGPTGLGTPNSAAAFSATGAVAGSPAKFGAIGKVTSAQIAGLPVSLSLTPMIPDGDQLASVSWRAARADCALSATNVLNPTVSCPAGLLGATSVTGTVTDTAGQSKAVSVGLNFTAVTTKRSVSLSLNVAGQSGAAQSLCTGAATPIQANLIDTATGLPVKGVTASFSRKAGTAVATTAGTAMTSATGTATVTASSTAAITLGAKTNAVGPFSANAGVSLAVTVGRCTPTLGASMDVSTSYYGDPVQVSGTVTRDAAGSQVPLPNAAVQIAEVVNGKTTVLGTATSTSSGSFAGTVKPTVSGALSAVLASGTGWIGTSAALGNLAVLMPTTTLTSSADRSDVGYGDTVTVSGSLIRNAGGTTSPLAKSVVNVRSTESGKTTLLGSATTAADGSYRIAVHPKAAGELSAVYGGAAGQPGSTVDVGAISVGTWDAAVTLSVPVTLVTAGNPVKLSGTVSRTYESQSSNAPSVPVGIYLRASNGVLSLLTTLSSTAAGTFSGTVSPGQAGSLVARVHSVPGYNDADSADVALQVWTRVIATAPTVVSGGRPAVVSVSLTVPRGGVVTVQELSSGTWVDRAQATAASTGRASISVAGLALGSHTLRAYYAGDALGAANASASLVVLVKA